MQTTADRVKGVRGVPGSDGGRLRAEELGPGAKHIVLAFLVGVVTTHGVEQSKVRATVGDNADDGDANAVVEAGEAARLDCLGEAVNEAAELLLAGSHVGGQASTSVVERVHDHKRPGTGETARRHVDAKELEELGVLVGPREHSLDGVLESEVEGLGGEVTDDVGEVPAPEGLEALLPADADKAIDDPVVARHLPTDDFGIGILRLDQELDALNGGGGGLGNGTRHATGEKVDDEFG